MLSIEITFSITNVNYVTFPFAINFSGTTLLVEARNYEFII